MSVFTRPSNPNRLEGIAIFACIAALLACGGTKSWSERPVQVPTRSLNVDEAALFASNAACAPMLELAVAKSCEPCGPIVVWRGAERVATLLAAPSAAPAPVPEDMRPAYTTAGSDANRTSLHLPLRQDGDALRLEGRCAVVVEGAGSGIEARDGRVELGSAVTRACKTVSLEVECR